jgi:hypothetical protein
VQKARDALGGSDSGVEEKSGINLTAFGILRAGEAFFERGGLRGGEAPVGFRAFADQRFWIEVAGFLVEDHAIFHAVERVALIDNAFDHGHPVAVRKSAFCDRRSFVIFGRDLVERGRDPAIANTGVAGAHGR